MLKARYSSEYSGFHHLEEVIACGLLPVLSKIKLRIQFRLHHTDFVSFVKFGIVFEHVESAMDGAWE